MLAGRANHRAVAVFERRTPIRKPSSLLGVEKIEGDDVDAEIRQRAGELDHERAVLAGARAVAQHERGADRSVIGAASGVDERRRSRARPDRDVEFKRLSQWRP